jgi:pimeloyl-ACP methyl ester carboxylesterase
MPISTITHNKQTFCLSYKIHNLDKKIDIIILHGWGSNKEIMQTAFANQKSFSSYRLIFIDLPGFGKSNNDYVLNTYNYADILDVFCKKNKITKDIIIGHSFGGKIATLLNPKLLVLLSSAGIVENKPLFVYTKIYFFKLFRYLGLGFLYKLFVSKDAKDMSQSMYETFKSVVDERFDKVFRDFVNQTLIFWGDEDKATSVISGEKIHSLIKKNKFFKLGGDHFFFTKLQNSIIISDTIDTTWSNND